MKAVPTEIRVLLWGDELGCLSWNAKTGRSHFFFAPSYFEKNLDIAPIVAPKNSPESHFAIYGNTDNKIYQKLPPFIADSLPDDWGNTLFDQWFKDNGLHEKDKTPIAKLSFIGSRAMGAFEFVPSEDAAFEDTEELSLGNLYSLASKIEEDRENAVILPEESLTKKALLAVGTSAGGRFKKAIIAIAQDGSIHSGQTSANPEWKYCIVKFNTPSLCLSEIEQTYYELAVDAGVEMEHSELIEVEGVRHFRTERFDRKEGKKILTMSLAAVNPDAASYEDLFCTCNKLGISEKEKAQIFKRMVFNILASNTDDHSKNFSFVLDNDGSWHIAKAYDINFIFKSLNTAETDHCFSMRGKVNSFTEEDILSFAKEYGVKSAQKVISGIFAVLDSFKDKALRNGVRGDIVEIISRRLSQIHSEIEGSAIEETAWPSFVIEGHTIENFHFEKEEKGAFRVVALVDGNSRKKIISPKHQDYLIIADKFNDSSLLVKKRLTKEYFLNGEIV